MEKSIQTWSELTGLDDEPKKTEGNGFRRAVEARRKGQGRQPTAVQEQEARVESTEAAQDAREWQENIFRAREARVEESREQEKKWCEVDDDERVKVVRSMEAGSSYFQTTYPTKLRRS